MTCDAPESPFCPSRPPHHAISSSSASLRIEIPTSSSNCCNCCNCSFDCAAACNRVPTRFEKCSCDSALTRPRFSTSTTLECRAAFGWGWLLRPAQQYRFRRAQQGAAATVLEWPQRSYGNIRSCSSVHVTSLKVYPLSRHQLLPRAALCAYTSTLQKKRHRKRFWMLYGADAPMNTNLQHAVMGQPAVRVYSGGR